MGIEERLTDIGDRLAAQGATLMAIHDRVKEQGEKLDVLTTEGCVAGRDHLRRIEKLEDRPAKALATISTISGLLGGVAGWIAGMFGGGK